MSPTPQKRTVSASFRREMEREESGQAALYFLTISHPELDDDIRVVSDSKDYSYGGQTYIGFLFDLIILDDKQTFPEARLTVQNVDQKIGQVLRSVVSPPRIDIKIIQMTEFDLTVDPRTPISTPYVEYSAPELYLVDVDVTALEISGRIVSWNYSQELWPGVRATQSRCPGLFR